MLNDDNALRELLGYVGFTDEDARVLRALGPRVAHRFPAIVVEFYRTLDQTGAAASITGGEAQRERLRKTMEAWLESLFSGTYDKAYFAQRANVGRIHVRIELKQQYMFAAMNVMRRELHHALRALDDLRGDPACVAHDAIDKICDLELAVMLETYREAYQDKHRASERLATIGQLAASIGHELRNPLAVMETSVHLVGKRVDDARATKHIERVREQLAICGAIISDLLETARDAPPRRERASLAEVARQALALVPPLEGVAFALDLEGAPLFAFDPLQIRQLLTNLMLNAAQAIHAARRAGRVDVDARVDEGHVVIEVRDDGPGIARDALRRLFEPLFTTRARGVGLGLPLCRRIAEKHGGSIAGRNLGSDDAPSGASFEVRLPIVDARGRP